MTNNLSAYVSEQNTNIQHEIIRTNQKEEFTDFFLENAKNTLQTANILYSLSTDKQLQKQSGQQEFDGYLWVINTSYYSMFYAARALLEHNNVKLRAEQSIHALCFDALIYFFYLNDKLHKKLLEAYAQAATQANELLSTADELIETYYYEKNKRATFTYQTGKIAMKSKAQTSLKRARAFVEELRTIIEL
jgi:uncharacterized protein (UPF0332 family)